MMRVVSRVRSFWRNVTRRRRVESEIDAELQSYIQMLVDEKTRAGMREADARRSALLELGGAEQIKEQVRDMKAGLHLDAFIQDVRFGMRSLLKSPGLTAVALFSRRGVPIYGDRCGAVRAHVIQVERGNRRFRPQGRGLRRSARIPATTGRKSRSDVGRDRRSVERRAKHRQRKPYLEPSHERPAWLGASGRGRVHTA